jgi:hypothetical protein
VFLFSEELVEFLIDILAKAILYFISRLNKTNIPGMPWQKMCAIDSALTILAPSLLVLLSEDVFYSCPSERYD